MELLVVMGIVALLAGLVVPGLARARHRALGARCIGNLRQLGIAAQLYWDDHSGRAFPERKGREGDGWTYWFGWLGDGTEGDRVFDPGRGALWPYLGGRGVEICPSLDRAPGRFKSKARGAAFGYGYNLLMGPRGGVPVNVGHIPNPGRLAVLADCAQVNDFQPPASPERPLLEEFYYFGTNRLEATVHFRHGSRAQLVFVDGHVAAERILEGSEDARLPGERLGRLDPVRVVPVP